MKPSKTKQLTEALRQIALLQALLESSELSNQALRNELAWWGNR